MRKARQLAEEHTNTHNIAHQYTQHTHTSTHNIHAHRAFDPSTGDDKGKARQRNVARSQKRKRCAESHTHSAPSAQAGECCRVAIPSSRSPNPEAYARLPGRRMPHVGCEALHESSAALKCHLSKALPQDVTPAAIQPGAPERRTAALAWRSAARRTKAQRGQKRAVDGAHRPSCRAALRAWTERASLQRCREVATPEVQGGSHATVQGGSHATDRERRCAAQRAVCARLCV